MNTKMENLKMRILQLKNFDCKEWLEFSSVQQSEDAIRERALYDALHNTNSICYSYICKNSIMREEFIEELMFISSELFDFEYYDQEHIDMVVNLIDQGFKSREEQDKYLEQLASKVRIKNRETGKMDPDPFITKILTVQSIVADKLDWFYIAKFQNLSPEFINKHKKLIGAENQKIQTIYFSRSKKKKDELEEAVYSD